MIIDYLCLAFHNVKDIIKKYLVFEGFILGIFSGIIIIFYRLSLNFAENTLRNIIKYIGIHPYAIILWSFFICMIAFFIGELIRCESLISFSGIAHVKAELNHSLNADWLKVICFKIIGGFLCILSGLSLGRAGPSIQIGAMGGKGISKLFNRTGIDEANLIACGSGAGLSASFNVPITSIIFVFEGLKRKINLKVLIPLILSTFTAIFISKYLFGFNSVFHFSIETNFPIIYYLPMIILGILTGLLGRFHNKVFKIFLNLFQKYFKSNIPYRLIIAFVMAIILAVLAPSLLGSGSSLIISLIDEHLFLTSILLLLIVKYFFSMICMSSGAPGGTFFPILVIGSLIGAAYGTFLIQQFGINIHFLNNFVIYAMTGYFCAVTRSPLTAVFFITELIGNFTVLIPLFFISFSSYGIVILSDQFLLKYS